MRTILLGVIGATLAVSASAAVSFYSGRASWQAATSSRTDINFDNVAPYPNLIPMPPGLTLSGVNFSFMGQPVVNSSSLIIWVRRN